MSHHISGNVIVPHRHSAARHDLLSQQEAKLSRLQHTKACTTISQSCHHVTAVLRTLLIIGGVELNPGPNTTPETPNSPRFYSAFTSPELWRTPSNNQPSPSASLPWLRDRRSSSFSRSITGSHRGSHPSARSSLESNICFSDTVSSPVTPTTSPRVTGVTHRQTTTMAQDANRNLQLFDSLQVQNPVASTFSSVSPSMVPTAAPRHNGWTYLSSADQRTLPTVTSSTMSSTDTSRPSNAHRHFGWTYLSSADQMTLPAYTTATASSTMSSAATSRPSNAHRHFGWTYLSSADQRTVPTHVSTVVTSSTISTGTSRINTAPTVNRTPSTNINQLISSITSQLFSVRTTSDSTSHDSYFNQLTSTPIMSTTTASTQSNTMPRLNDIPIPSSSTTSHANRMPPQHCSNVVPAMSSQARPPQSPVRNQSNARADLYQQALRNATRTMQQMNFPSTDFQILRINSPGHSSYTQATPIIEKSNEPATQAMRQGNANNPIDNTTSFRANPFYEPVTELLKLTALENGKRSSICTDFLCEMQRNMYIQNISNFNYYFACIRFKLDLNSEIFQLNSKQMVQLRFCRLTAGTTGPYEDHLPSGLQINLNNKNMILPLPDIRHGEFYIPAQPINLKTHYLKIGETSQHLVVTWRHESNDDGTTVRNYANSVRYAIAVNIVKKLEPEEAVSRLSCIWSRERTESKIREQLQASALDEVAATTLHISLICPLSMVRIKTPVRFQSCRHLQCVDALALLRMNELSYGWRCPICNASSSYYKLHVDQYFADVLSSPLLPSTCSEIELQENGSWKPCYDPKVQDLDYRFNLSLNDSVVEITNGNKNCSAETPNKCDMNQSVLVTYEKYEKPAPFPRMNNTNHLIEKNLKELITNRLSLISSQDSQEQVQNEELDPYNFSLNLDISDEGMETTAPDNHEEELEPMVYNYISNSSTNQLSNISSIALDSELNFQTTPEKVQEPTTTVQSSDVTETTGVNIQDEVELPLSNELSFLVESFDASSTEKVHELQNETDLSETSTRTVDTNEHSFLGDAAENVHELTKESDLAETSTRDTNELSFLGDWQSSESSTENIPELQNETDLSETSTRTVDTNEHSFFGDAAENVHELTNETELAETSTQTVDISESSFDVESTENIHDLTNEGAPVQTKQLDVAKTVEKASRTTKTTTKKQVTKKKPLNVVPIKKTNRKSNKIVTFIISSDDSEDDDPRDPTHTQKTTNMNSSQDDAPHRPFTRSQARRAAGKKN